MRSFPRFFFALVFLTVWLTACGGAAQSGGLSAPSAPNAASAQSTPVPVVASLAEIAGQVLARQAVEAQFSPAQNGYLLELLGQVQTESQSTVRLDFPNGTLIRLGPQTLFTLEAPEVQPEGLLVRVRLELGRLWVILNGGSLEVETKSGVAAVRGSYLSVSFDPEKGQVEITCLEGRCSLATNAGSVEITAGQTASVTGMDQLPETGVMDEKDIQDWLANNPEAALVVPTASPEPEPTLSATPPSLLTPLPVFIYPSATSKPVKPAPPAPTVAPTAAPPSIVSSVMITTLAPVADVVVGEPITVTALVQSAMGGPPPTGTVKIMAGVHSVCSGSLVATGTLTCSGGIPEVGVYTVTAEYFGDANYLPSSSGAPALSKTVTQAATTITIQSQSPNPSLVNTPVTFTATVDHLYAPVGLPLGSVTFTSGADTCTATSAPWSCALTFTTDGTKTVIAAYSGDTNFSSSSVSGNVAQDVWATADTLFWNTGFIGPTSILYSGQCSQTYQITVVDLNGFNEVKVQYSVNDPTFSAPQSFLLAKTVGDLWARTEIMPATYPSMVYWRFVAIDGLGNRTYYDGAAAYTSGTGAYSYSLDPGLSSCP